MYRLLSVCGCFDFPQTRFGYSLVAELSACSANLLIPDPFGVLAIDFLS